MKYTLINPELDAQIIEIEHKIRLSMNGIVSSQMTQKGILYRKNYGVSFPRMKEIASLYTQNHDLAQRLWRLHIRETMILATLLEPVDKFNLQNAQDWVESFNQIEIVEQACMNLFCKLPYADKLCMDWVRSNHAWIKISGFLLAARIVDSLHPEERKSLIQEAMRMSDTDNFHLYKAVAICLSRFCRKDTETATYILKEITAIQHTTSVGQQYILSEVKQELLFLNNL